MRMNKFTAIISAIMIACTLSMPSFAFAKNGTPAADDRVQAVAEKNINAKSAAAGLTSENPAEDFEYSDQNGEVVITMYVGTDTKVVIPKNIEGLPVTSIGNYAFSNCDSLESITIPEGVESIESYAFNCCGSLSSITIPNSVTSIGEGVFSDCNSLESIVIQKGVTNIGDDAFSGCSSLKSIVVSEDNKTYSSSSGVLFNKNKTSLIIYPKGKIDTSYAIPQGVTNIEDLAFSYCSKLKSVTIPEGTTNIGNATFTFCSKLESVTIPKGVTSIGDATFAGCSSLSSIIIPESVTDIIYATFAGCSSLSSVTMHEGVTSIGPGAFSGCSKLSKIKLPGSLVDISSDAFNRTITLVVYRNSYSHEFAVANNINYEIDEDEIQATSISISQETLELEPGGHFILKAEVLPQNTSQKTVKWSTVNPDVISIRNNGTIIALKAGEATVTATTAHGLTATCHIHVHNWNKETVIQNANCTDDEITKYVCTSCAKSKNAVTAEAFGHKWNNGEIAIEPACDTEGMRVFKCENCTEEKSESIDPTGHSYAEELTADSKTHWNECHCGARTNEEAHNWHTEYRTIKEAKCTEAGSKAIFCKDCDTKKEESEVKIDPLDHAYGIVTIDPTCSQGGFDLHICGRCGDSSKDNETLAKGHSFGDWQTIKASSCTEEGSEQRTCGECEYTETRGVVKKAHNWETDYTVDKKATCTTDGSKSIHCADCDAVKDSTVIEATGHDYSEWEITKQPSCKETGICKRTCSKCHIEESLELAKKSHDWKSEYTIDKPACTEDGSKSIHCRDCDAVKDSTVISVSGHDYSDYITEKKANFKADGIKVSTCSNCGDKRTKTIPKAEQPVLSDIEYIYDGRAKEPGVTVKNSLGEELTIDDDYDVKYKNNKNVGTATARITGIGDYSGTVNKTFKINPPKTAITSLTKSKKAFTVKWTKKTSQVTGYQIMYARNSKFTSNKKTATVTSYKTTSKKISKLSAKKKYYVKARTYKTVKGVKYYSPWSNYKTVTTK